MISHLDWRQGWRPFFWFELLCKLVAVAVFAPVSAFFADAIVSSAGDGAISNYDLTAFFLSPAGVLFVFVVVTLFYALLFFEVGGLVIVASGVMDGQPVSAHRVLRFLATRLPALWRMGLRQFLTLGALALPVLVIAGIVMNTLLAGSDINYYLQVKPPAFKVAVAIVGTAALLWLVIAVRLQLRWIFSLPALLLEKRRSADAMARSRILAQGRKLSLLRTLAGWAITIFALFAIAGALQWVVRSVLLGIAGDQAGLLLPAAALVVAIQFFFSVFVSFAATVSLGWLVARRYREVADPPRPAPESVMAKRNDNPEEHRANLRKGGWLWGGAAALTVATIVLSYKVLDLIEVDDSVFITAHRGSSITAPENTYAAIDLAIEEGADYVEIDVQETRDGVLVLLHDKDLKRVTGVAKGIWEVDASELAELEVGSWFDPKFEGEKVPTLREVIERVRGKAKLNIELKFNGHDQRLAEATIDLLRELKFENDSVLTSLEYGGLVRAKAYGPEIKTGLIVTATVGNVTSVGTDFLSISSKSVNRNLVALAHGAGKEIHVWTVNEPAEMHTMIHVGVDNIITDTPEVLRNLLVERAELDNAQKVLLLMSDLLNKRL